jgi:hypothetical protein
VRGQIGNNSTMPAPFPTTAQALNDAIAVSAGAFFTCAVRVGGVASCWGANDSGELSAAESGDHLVPSAVIQSDSLCPLAPGHVCHLVLSNVVAISTGSNPSIPGQEHACAVRAGGDIACWGANAFGQLGNGTNTNAGRPVSVNSFLANVDPAAALRNGRIAEVTALINCESGGSARITLMLLQGAVSGTGHAEAQCTGELQRIPLDVPAQGPSGFQAGAATAQVEAVVTQDNGPDGRFVEDTHWTRQVVLAPTN